MNERIRELAEQAGLKVESFMTNPPKPFQILGSTEQFEKFAELLVGECLFIIDDERKPEMVSRIELWKQIVEHFGVE